jgi:hypothetical protein
LAIEARWEEADKRTLIRVTAETSMVHLDWLETWGNTCSRPNKSSYLGTCTVLYSMCAAIQNTVTQLGTFSRATKYETTFVAILDSHDITLHGIGNSCIQATGYYTCIVFTSAVTWGLSDHSLGLADWEFRGAAHQTKPLKIHTSGTGNTGKYSNVMCEVIVKYL